ncbi:DUF937 domain-containing protein [Methylobacterium trifolii]|uniref:DUF937 domain-containing protein n=1 Tax=Methylobacterium trifolii TaxID=1003092 RepID=A0ABQ4U0D3_9HYPH|nr:DUF937 domain-containing protein [Methylobacterium trifolii]GJE60943.1 hypothetical protein MPOCJGCO_3062 [Methylobacterium trifolii]
MFNPIDMLQMPGGAGMQTMGQQFGITPEQTRKAMEALLPVFAIGLQRKAPDDPTGLANLFGSPMLTQAILHQASSASGVGSQVLRQMLPMMAGAVVASVVHMLLNQPEAARAPAPAPAASPFPVNPVWADMLKAFMPPNEAAPQRPKPAPAPQVRAGTKPAEKDSADAGRDMLQQMLKTGAEVQEQNVKAIQGLFDAFWSEASKPSAPPPVAPSAAGSPEEPAPKPRRGRAPPDSSGGR